MSDLGKIDRALEAISARDVGERHQVFESVKAQLLYLRELLLGGADRTRLRDIILGVQAAKEFDGDAAIADPLFEAAEVAERLRFPK